MNPSTCLEKSDFKERSHSNIDYYTVWSGDLMLASIIVLLLYVVGVIYQQISNKLVSSTALLLRSVVRGILIFTAVNSIAVLVTSFHMDANGFDRRFEMGTEDTQKKGVSIEETKKILKLHFKVHVIPVLLSMLIFTTLLFTSRFERKHKKYQGWSAVSAILFGVLFVLVYLSVPAQVDGSQFKRKLDSIYLEPETKTLVLFVGVLLSGCIAGNLF